MNHEEFKALIEGHDLTFTFSDDDRHYRAGRASYDRVISAAKTLPYADARRIWNEMVDRNITSGSRELFYWPEEAQW